MKGKEITIKAKGFMVMGYIFLIVGSIELVMNLLNSQYSWMDTFAHLSAGTALLMGYYEIKNKIVNALQISLIIIWTLCMLAEVFG